MKKIAIGALAVAFSTNLFISCEDIAFLNQAPYSSSSPENFYKTTLDFENAIVGCYDVVGTHAVGSVDVTYGTYKNGLVFMLTGGNDESVLSNNPGTNDYTAFGQAAYTAVNSAVGQHWTAYFAGVMRCNYVIDKAKDITFDGEGAQARLEEIVAEAHFLRGFFYLHLAQLFGGVPVYTAPESDAYAARQPIEDVYKVIIPDFEYAYSKLPHRATVMGAANKWTAAGYLAVVYNYLAACKRNNVGGALPNSDLNKFDWVDANAMTAAAQPLLEDVILNSGYILTPKYDCLFREATKAKQQEECLFTYEVATVTGGDSYPASTLLFAPGSSALGGSFGIYRGTMELYKSYNQSLDVRYKHNVTGNYQANVTETVEGGVYLVPAAAVLTSTTLFIGKYRIQKLDTRALSASNSGISMPLLRYADILLQYAETMYFLGDETTARAMLTQVRSRALAAGQAVEDLDIAYHKTNFLDELLDERRRELCAESKRRIDLIRFGRLTSAIEGVDVTAGGANDSAKALKENWAEYKIWFPIPQSQRDMNKNLTQNNGY
ncbi:MAG: RagB/SusD family nutrient uptake outer membrane protein [Dysgonamonadaceae bacterium]|nr:RagB/SusD family nutrient uptake outer membrane protein [Dysgonamonadaceae bacterium]